MRTADAGALQAERLEASVLPRLFPEVEVNVGKNNLKEEKAKRNKEYALKYKKSRRPGGGRPRAPRPMDMSSGGEEGSSHGGPRPRSITMFSAVCSGCGQEAKLPFEPTSGKPVFCDSCFQKQRA